MVVRWERSELSENLETLKSYINSGRWPKALKLARNAEFEKTFRDSAHYWFLRSLIEQLFGHPDGAPYCHRQAEACPDYSSNMEGDFIRDEALKLIRRKKLRQASLLLEQVEPFHHGWNRKAVLLMSRGCLAYAKRDHAAAIAFFKNAEKHWHHMEQNNAPYDTQWRSNNRFHLLKALVAMQLDTKDIYALIAKTDASAMHQRRARLITKHRWANRLDDLVVRCLS